MWDKIAQIYSGDVNVKRARPESLRGRFDDMKMREGENIMQYTNRIKEVVHTIRGLDGVINEDTMVSKILRTLFPIYAIKIFAIHENRSTPNNTLTLDNLIGKLTTFELNNYDNSVVPNVESTFMTSLKIGKSSRKNNKDDSDRNTNDELDELEALMARWFPKGKGRYRGKLTLACFNYKEVGHISARCPHIKMMIEPKTYLKEAMGEDTTKATNTTIETTEIIMIKARRYDTLLRKKISPIPTMMMMWR